MTTRVERRRVNALSGGRGELRHGVYEALMTTIRCDPSLRAHHQQLIARGKPYKVALVACMRRLLGILNAMIRDGLTWQETKVGQGLFLPTDHLTFNTVTQG